MKGPSKEIPESPSLFSYSIQDLIDSLESKLSFWYLEDGNLSDDYIAFLKDFKILVEAEKTLRVKTESVDVWIEAIFANVQSVTKIEVKWSKKMRSSQRL